jgi:hypothetical protein
MKKITLFLFFIYLSGYAQQKILKGTVEVKLSSLHGITVENISRETQTQTDDSGSFSIEAEVGDALVFSSVAVKKRVFFVREDHFENPPIIKLTTDNVELDAVEISSQQINLRGLPQQDLSVAEKSYQRSGKIVSFDQGLVFNLEAVGNLFNGKRKQLKKEVELAQKEQLRKSLDNYFDDVFYTETLRLDREYIEDFKFFLVDDPEFLEILKSKNEGRIYLEVPKVYDAYLKTKEGEK